MREQIVLPGPVGRGKGQDGWIIAPAMKAHPLNAHRAQAAQKGFPIRMMIHRTQRGPLPRPVVVRVNAQRDRRSSVPEFRQTRERGFGDEQLLHGFDGPVFIPQQHDPVHAMIHGMIDRGRVALRTFRLPGDGPMGQ